MNYMRGLFVSRRAEVHTSFTVRATDLDDQQRPVVSQFVRKLIDICPVPSITSAAVTVIPQESLSSLIQRYLLKNQMIKNRTRDL
jgi:hypothetical protein